MLFPYLSPRCHQTYIDLDCLLYYHCVVFTPCSSSAPTIYIALRQYSTNTFQIQPNPKTNQIGINRPRGDGWKILKACIFPQQSVMFSRELKMLWARVKLQFITHRTLDPELRCFLQLLVGVAGWDCKARLRFTCCVQTQRCSAAKLRDVI